MSEIKRSVPTHPDDEERAIRRILRKYALKAKRVLLSPTCHSCIENIIRGQIAMLELLKREARRRSLARSASKSNPFSPARSYIKPPPRTHL